MQIHGRDVPVKVYREYRSTVRASLAKNAAILRMPLRMERDAEEHYLQWFREWLERQLGASPAAQHLYTDRTYADGDQLTVGGRLYTIRLIEESRATHMGRLLPGRVLELRICQADSPAHTQKCIRHLLSRLVSDDCLPDVRRRVQELNHLFFRQPVKEVRLRLNQRTWGSCSSSGSINLSSRLLFATAAAMDYVIIHELAHLLEMNHSDRFWKLVRDAMPEYKVQERWLKENNHLCRF